MQNAKVKACKDPKLYSKTTWVSPPQVITWGWRLEPWLCILFSCDSSTLRLLSPSLHRTGSCLRPYHAERAPSRLTSEAKQARAWWVPGWENQHSRLACLCDVTSGTPFVYASLPGLPIPIRHFRGFPIRILTGSLLNSTQWTTGDDGNVQLWRQGRKRFFFTALLLGKPQIYPL